MPTVAFLSPKYRTEPVKTDRLLGVCDPEGEQPAYSTSATNGPDRWVATVVNESRKPIQFVPIDKNIKVYKPDGKNLESTCDGMLLSGNERNVFFVELKDVSTGGWASDALEQVESTIRLFLASYDYRTFKLRRAYLANRRHPHFLCSYREKLQEFKLKYHFTLCPQAKIVVE